MDGGGGGNDPARGEGQASPRAARPPHSPTRPGPGKAACSSQPLGWPGGSAHRSELIQQNDTVAFRTNLTRNSPLSPEARRSPSGCGFIRALHSALQKSETVQPMVLLLCLDLPINTFKAYLTPRHFYRRHRQKNEELSFKELKHILDYMILLFRLSLEC